MFARLSMQTPTIDRYPLKLMIRNLWIGTLQLEWRFLFFIRYEL